jgi:hypothetical protein
MTRRSEDQGIGYQEIGGSGGGNNPRQSGCVTIAVWNAFYFSILYVTMLRVNRKDSVMAYRYGDRKQKMLFPQSIDEYIPQEAPVRASTNTSLKKHR